LAKSPGGSRRIQEAAQSAPDSPGMLNDLAWLLATHPDAALRNGPKRHPRRRTRVCHDEAQEPKVTGYLAAAYAETGSFPDAISTAQEGASLAQSSGGCERRWFGSEFIDLLSSEPSYHEYPVSP